MRDHVHGDNEPGTLALLLQAVAAGDRVAFRRIYDTFAPRLTGVAARITGDPALARDVVHEAFVQVWREAGRFDPARGSGEGWLLGLVRWRAIALMRRRRRESLGYEGGDQADDAPDPLHRLMTGDQGQALAACLRSLGAEREKLVVLAYIEGMSHPELAAALRLPLGTVKSTLRRSLALLRRCLSP